MEQFADIEGPVRIGVMGIVLITLAVVVAVIVAVLIIRTFLRRATSKPELSGDPVRSPFEIAIGRLQALRTSQSGLEAEPFTVEVSDIVRDYLEESLSVPAREQTSEEFLQTLQARNDAPDSLRENMPLFLEECDKVKFARQSLAGGQKEALLETARTVVESTQAHLSREGEPAQTSSIRT